MFPTEYLTEVELFAIDLELLRGRKIEAIKIHRGLTHKGLGESKEFVEKRAAELSARLLRMSGACGNLEEVIITLLRPK